MDVIIQKSETIKIPMIVFKNRCYGITQNCLKPGAACYKNTIGAPAQKMGKTFF